MVHKTSSLFLVLHGTICFSKFYEMKFQIFLTFSILVQSLRSEGLISGNLMPSQNPGYMSWAYTTS